ncbi:hypothetical protein ANTRET_LOCUS1894 [Anthophora retusa]
MLPVLLLIFMVAEIQCKPTDRLTDDSINRINQGRLTEVEIVEEDPTVTSTSKEGVNQGSEISSTTTKPGFITWFLTPLTQNLQINPENIQNRVTQLKEILGNLGLRGREEIKGKQLSNANNLLQLVGANDSGFYTNRLDPAGFFGGNGWFANKGGILGGPGAILSTGSVLTDYPTAYRRK